MDKFRVLLVASAVLVGSCNIQKAPAGAEAKGEDKAPSPEEVLFIKANLTFPRDGEALREQLATLNEIGEKKVFPVLEGILNLTFAVIPELCLSFVGQE